MEYGVISTCRNEGKNIKKMIMSVLSQSIRPYAFILIDDDSKDDTFMIIKEISKYNDNFYPIHKEFKRLMYGGFNMTVALNYAYEKLIKMNADIKYVLKIDGDVVLNDVMYVEKIINIIEKDVNAYLGGGRSIKLLANRLHVQDGAKIYRKICLETIKEYHGSAFPKMYGFDTYMQLFIQYLGYKIKSCINITYFDTRPFTLNSKRAVMSGKFHYINNYPILHELKVLFMTIRHNRHHKLQSMIRLFTYLIYHLKMGSPLAKDYRKFNHDRFKAFFMDWLYYRAHLLRRKLGMKGIEGY